MDEESDQNQYIETDRKNQNINIENEMNERQRENLNLIQEGINQDINLENLDINKSKDKEMFKETKKYYENLSINKSYNK